MSKTLTTESMGEVWAMSDCSACMMWTTWVLDKTCCSLCLSGSKLPSYLYQPQGNLKSKGQTNLSASGSASQGFQTDAAVGGAAPLQIQTRF